MKEPILKSAAVAAILTVIASSARAQDPLADPTPTPLADATTFFRPEVSKALPSAGSLTGRVVLLNSGLVLEREEGAGLFPAEPSRFAFRGGSWTQSRIEIDGFDVTDPFFGGRPLAWSAVEFGEVDVVTDARGTVLTHAREWRKAGAPRFVAGASFGLFDDTGTPGIAPLPALARSHNLFDGYAAFSGGDPDGDTNWSVAGSGADVTRSERESLAERGTQRLGFEGRIAHRRGDDTWRGLALYQGRRMPFGLTDFETRANGLLVGAEWTRTEAAGPGREMVGYETRFLRASYRRGRTEDPTFGDALPFERIIDGAPSYQAPYDATADRLGVSGGTGIELFDDVVMKVGLDLGRASSARTLSQPTFAALERLNGASAREWTFTASPRDGARLSEGSAALNATVGFDTSERTRLEGKVTAQYLRVGDRDGSKILDSLDTLRELTFTWRKSEETKLTIEASMGVPPVPLATWESAATGVPSVTARLWRDVNADARATSNELGAEVARRGSGSVTADPDLHLPRMKRLTATFRTKLGPIGMQAVGYLRRDTDLVENVLAPYGSEILRTRNLPDPSGDIVGPSDDQLLPVVEETSASFASSRYVLTNAPEHRALGEGAELLFDANSKHWHWGLSGAAFRASGRGGNRGMRVTENDFGVVGESFDRTNADTYGYGRLFFDRAYSLRMFLTANDVKGFTFGAIGRYDDGQPFARLVIQNDLPQGPDFVQAIARGRARLHYTLSVDARLARRFELGRSGGAIEISASVFNALGHQFEADEQVVFQADYRRITMAPPPRAFVIGVRVEP